MVNKKIIILSALIALMAMPVAALGFNIPSEPVPITNLTPVGLVLLVLGWVWPVAVTVIIIMFTAAGFLYLTSKGEPGKVHQAHQAVIWGVAGVAVVILAWSVVLIVRTWLGS